MVHLAGQTPRFALHHHMLMHLIVATFRIHVRQLFITAQPVFEEPQVPVWVIGMLQPFAHEAEPPVDPIACHRMIRLRHDPTKLFLALRRHHLIRIEDENPVMLERQVLQRPVFFLRPDAIERELHDLCPKPRGDFLRPIRALRINDEDFIRPSHRSQAARKIHRFVLDRDEYGDGDSHRARD